MKKTLTLFSVFLLTTAAVFADLPFRNHRYDAFKVLPVTSEDIVFIGNSITNMHEWWEAFNNHNVKNRGVSGAVTDEGLENIEAVAAGKPKKVFIMLGTNDLGTDGINNAAHVKKNVSLMIDRFRQTSPDTKIYIQSILPSNSGLRTLAIEQETNTELKALCDGTNVIYVDLWDAMSGVETSSNGLSYDGLHLTAAGYKIWCDIVAPYVMDVEDAKSVYPESASTEQQNGDLSGAYGMRATVFSLLPVNTDDILIIGDEMVHGGEWHELLQSSKVKNRGTAWGYPGPSLSQMLSQIPVILHDDAKPAQVFLYAGVSDVNGSTDLSTVLTNYKAVVNKILELSSETKVTLMSLQPTSTAATNTDRVAPFNEMLSAYAAENADDKIEYLDIYTDFATDAGVANTAYFSGNYLYGKGYVKVAQKIATAIDDESVVAITDDVANSCYTRFTNRTALGEAIVTAALLPEGDEVGEYTTENLADVKTAITNAYSALASSSTASDEFTDNVTAVTSATSTLLPKINLPAASSEETETWYLLYTPNRNSKYLTSNGAGAGVTGEDANNYSISMWKFVSRDDDTFDIINRKDGSYLSPVANYDSQISTSEAQPDAGWTLEYSNSPGLFIIHSDNVQLNQTTKSGTPVYNWSSGQTGTDRDDDGCQYKILEVTGTPDEEPTVPTDENFDNVVTKLGDLTEGWYKMRVVQSTDATVSGYITSGTHNVLNANTEYRQSSSNFYSLKFAAYDTEKPATGWVYIKPIDSKFMVQSINGHVLNENCTSSRSLSANTTITMTYGGFSTVDKWHYYNPSDGNEKPYIGKSSSSNNIFAFAPVKDDELAEYDVYKVVINDVEDATEIGSDSTVTYTGSSEIGGISKVFNNGYFFFPTGTVPVAADFLIPAGDLELAVDTTQKTLTVAAIPDTSTTVKEYLVSTTTGVLSRNGSTGQSWNNLWSFTTTSDLPAALTFASSANNMTNSNGNFHIYEGTAGSATYTLTVPEGEYLIKGYSFDHVRVGSADVTITIGSNTYTSTTDSANIQVSGLSSHTTSFTLSGSNKGVQVSNFVVLVDEYYEGNSKELYNAIREAEEVLETTAEGNDPGCYSSATRSALQTAIDNAEAVNNTLDADYQSAITVLQSAVTEYYAAVQTVKYSTTEDRTWYYIISDSEHSYCNTKAIKSCGVGTPLTFADKMLDPSMVWSFEQNSEGLVAVYNYAGGYMSSVQDKNNSAAGMSETAAFNYTIEQWNGESPSGSAFTIKSDASSNPIHAQSANTVIVTWAAADNNASLWRLVELTADELATTSSLSSTTVQQGIAVTGIGNTHVPLLRMQFAVEGLDGTAKFSGLKGNLNNTAGVANELHIYSVSDVYEYRESKSDAVLVSTTTPADDGTFEFRFDENVNLPCGISSYYWLVADISENAEEGAVIDAAITSYTINETEITESNGNPEYSTKVLLTASTVEYLNTESSRYYRIPAITTAMNGWLVAVTDKRYSSNNDLPNNIDVVARVSKDNGKTWTEPVTIAGTAALGGDYGHGDPAIVTDRITGDIIVLVTSKVGFFSGTPEDPARLKVIISHDNGLTWDAPVDITDDIYGAGCSDETRQGWYSMFFSSGAFIQTSKGSLMCVAPVRTTSSSTHSTFEAHIIRSDDHGKTWTCNGVSALSDADESKIVELNDGRLLVKSRKQGGGDVYYSISDDDGLSWSERSQFDEVYDPGCNGDIIRFTSEAKSEGANRLLLSIPDATSRKNVTVYLSTDEAQTWPVKKSICESGSAYSSMTILEDGTVGIYYEEDALEGGYQMRYARFSLDWLTSDTDELNYEAFAAARLKEAQALAAYLPEISETVNDASQDVAPGYYATVYNTTSQLESELSSAATSSDLQTVQDALTAYMSTYESTLMLPVDGRVYRIKSVIDSSVEGYLNHYLANADSQFPTETDSETTLWVCQQSADGSYRTFVSAVGDKYFGWRGTNAVSAVSYEVRPGTELGRLGLWNPNGNSTNDGRYLAVTNEYHNSSDGTASVAYNQATSTSQNATWSTDFAFEEVPSEEYAGFAASVYEGKSGNYGTLNLPFAVYMPEGVTAKSVSYDAADSSNELVESEISLDNNILPANTPILLASETAQEYAFVPAPAFGTSAKETGFKGTLGATAVTDENAYILSYENGTGSEIRFYLLDSSDNVINANKAYFVLSGANASTSLRLSGGNTTAIEEIENTNADANAIYDLTGRKLDAITAPGIYIINGRTVLVK